MTAEQKQEYVDCVVYLRNYATAMENDEHIAKFCYDIAKKAEFLYKFRVHLFPPETGKDLEYIHFLLKSKLSMCKEH